MWDLWSPSRFTHVKEDDSMPKLVPAMKTGTLPFALVMHCAALGHSKLRTVGAAYDIVRSPIPELPRESWLPTF